MKMPPLIRHPIGFLEFAEKPTKEELAQYYAEAYYQDDQAYYQKQYPTDELQHLTAKIWQKATLANQLWGLEKPGSVLDVGCGQGYALDRWRQMGWQIKGLEHGLTGVRHCNPHLLDDIEEGDLFDSLARHIDGGETYDIVWLTNVLEHVITPVELMQSLTKLVKQDGIVVVSVPNDGSRFHQLLEERELINRPFWQAYPDHLSYFDSDSLRAICNATGWQVIDMISDFPVDMYLAHPGSNYLDNRDNGKAAHKVRVMMENMIDEKGTDAANDFYRALAGVGLGRNLTVFLRLQESVQDG